MIVTSLDGELLMVTQNDHAALAAELLSLWRIDGVPQNPRRPALLRAAREHDNGWLEADSAPRRRPDGRPHDFMSTQGEVRREIWWRGVRRHGDEPWVAALILEHALSLHRRHRDDEAWRDDLAAWREMRDELLAGSAAGAAELRADYRLLDATDTLSLALCAGWREAGEHAGVRYRARLRGDVADLEIEPFPLAGVTTLRLAVRHIADRPYDSDADLAMTLAQARWRRLPVRVCPFDSSDVSPPVR